jgi:hypothetical protein
MITHCPICDRELTSHIGDLYFEYKSCPFVVEYNCDCLSHYAVEIEASTGQVNQVSFWFIDDFIEFYPENNVIVLKTSSYESIKPPKCESIEDFNDFIRKLNNYALFI